MIDEDWLRRLKFTMKDGSRCVELLGTGGSDIIFGIIRPDGAKLALRVSRQNLAWYLKAVPNFLTAGPTYDLTTLNTKVLGLVAKPYFETLTGVYTAMVGAIVALLHEHGVDGLLHMVKDSSLEESVPLLLNSRAVRLRLEEFATQKSDERYPGAIPAAAAENLLEDLRRKDVASGEEVQLLSSNPLYVWGAAVMDGLYEDHELPDVAAFIDQRFGNLATGPNSLTVISQIGAVADFLAQVVQHHNVTRLVRLCAAAHIMLVVFDSDGRMVPGMESAG